MKTAGIRKMFTVFTILLGIGLLASVQAYAWTKTATFETGTNGALAQGSSLYDYAGTTTTVSADRAISGTKSSKMVWAKGTEGFNLTHGEVYFPSNVFNGGEVWVRGYYYFASPWSWASNTGTYSMIKILRFMSDSGGVCGLVADSSGNMVLSDEPAQIADYPPFTLDVGKWQSLEVYVKLSTSNSGIVRIWKDGVLVAERTGVVTLANSYVRAAQFMGVWNNGVGNNQTQYLDDIVITTDTPSQRDSRGNAMIGTVNGTSTAILPPPTGLRATAS